jgi:hypothetical protein
MLMAEGSNDHTDTADRRAYQENSHTEEQETSNAGVVDLIGPKRH